MDDRFVVVAGSPRSGTSLLRTILRKNRELCVHATEPHYVLELYQRYGTTIANPAAATEFLVAHDKFPRAVVDPQAMRAAVQGRTSITLSELLRICYRLLKGTEAQRPVVLKHPAWILHLDLIHSLLPNLVVVQSVRDPRANVLSQRTRWPSTSAWEGASKWRESIAAGRKWQARAGSPYLEVKYEDLVTAPQSTCERLCRFLGIGFDPAMLALDHVEREWDPNNPGEGSKRSYQTFEPQRIDKWKKHLSPMEVKIIEDRCQDGMALFGYEPTHPPVDSRAYWPFYLKERRRAVVRSVRRTIKRRRRAAAGV